MLIKKKKSTFVDDFAFKKQLNNIVLIQFKYALFSGT